VHFYRCSRNSQGCFDLTVASPSPPPTDWPWLQVRMQSKAYLGKYLNTADGISKIFRQEGLVAFTRGFEPSLWRQGVWNGMSVVFATCRSLVVAAFLTLLHQFLRHLALFFSNVAVCWHQQGQHHNIKILVRHALRVMRRIFASTHPSHPISAGAAYLAASWPLRSTIRSTS